MNLIGSEQSRTIENSDVLNFGVRYGFSVNKMKYGENPVSRPQRADTINLAVA